MRLSPPHSARYHVYREVRERVRTSIENTLHIVYWYNTSRRSEESLYHIVHEVRREVQDRVDSRQETGI